MGRKVTKLTNGDIFKVDLVPKGAQPNAKILLTKSEGGNGMGKLFKSAKSVTKQADIEDAKLDKALEAIETIISALNLKTEDIEEDEAAEKEDAIAEKEDFEAEKQDIDNADNLEDGNGLEKEEGGDVKESDVKKSATDIQLAKALDEIKETRQKLAKMEDDKITQEFITKAGSYTNIPCIEANELGVILKSLNSVNPEGCKKLEGVLKSADELLANGSDIFNEYGSNNSEAASANTSLDCWDAIEKIADSKVAKGDTTREKALSDVLKSAEGQRLYMKYESLLARGK